MEKFKLIAIAVIGTFTITAITAGPKTALVAALIIGAALAGVPDKK